MLEINPVRAVLASKPKSAASLARRKLQNMFSGARICIADLSKTRIDAEPRLRNVETKDSHRFRTRLSFLCQWPQQSQARFFQNTNSSNPNPESLTDGIMKKKTQRIIIDIRHGIHIDDALRKIGHVVQGGKISNYGKQHCYHTSFGDGQHVSTFLNKCSERFVVHLNK